jgi:hypothetical protein
VLQAKPLNRDDHDGIFDATDFDWSERLRALPEDWPVPSSKSARGPSIVKLRLRAWRGSQRPAGVSRTSRPRA